MSAHQDKLLVSLLAKKDVGRTAYPGVEGFIRVPESSGDGSDRLSRERLNILSGTSYLYVLIAMKYRDDTMPENVFKVTEGCFRFNGPLSVYLECGRNGSHLTR